MIEKTTTQVIFNGFLQKLLLTFYFSQKSDVFIGETTDQATKAMAMDNTNWVIY